MKKYGILFVCTGNICRSPTAEGVLRHRIEKRRPAGLFQVDSAGTHGYHVGEPPDSRAVKAAAGRGIDISTLRARKFSVSDFNDFDLILAMDGGHFKILENLRPHRAVGRLAMFTDFREGAGNPDVPDPYYGEQADFEAALDIIEEGVQGILRHLEQEKLL